MGTSVNNKCKAFTSLEQSKLLAKILPLESADMCYIAHSELINIHEPFYKKMGKKDIPCWSLAALLDVLSNYQLQTQDNGIGILCSYNGKFNIVTADNPVDACVELIIKLHKQNLLRL